MKHVWFAGIAALAAALSVASAAHASTVTISNNNEIRVAESGNENNQIFVAYSPAPIDAYTVRDFAANLTPSGVCVGVNSSTAICPGAGITSIEVDTDARADVITLDATVPTTVQGDLDGGRDRDIINGGRGKDELRGGNGRDLLDGHEGADGIRGGRAADTLLYTTRTTTLVVTIGSGNDNDGNELDFSPGTLRDTVRGDVEIVLGGTAGDTIIGDNSSETLSGGDGNDFLIGNGGRDSLLGFGDDDVIFGGNGNDTLRGSLGIDRMLGGLGDDRLAAGAGDDALWGDPGRDVMKGKTGIDVIRARDGTRDIKINCGPGNNRREFAKRDKRLDPKRKSC